jgi:hypothetical protein
VSAHIRLFYDRHAPTVVALPQALCGSCSDLLGAERQPSNCAVGVGAVIATEEFSVEQKVSSLQRQV